MLSTAESGGWPETVLDRPADAVLRLVDTEEVVRLPVGRWHGPVLAEELAILEKVRSPVLDVGCGPGRHAAALRGFGHHALGIDSSPAAVRAAKRRGAAAINVSVFGPVPHAGDWATALLLDGNIGIGGDPVRLLIRLHHLLGAEGQVFVEVDPIGAESRRFHAQVQHAGGSGPGFAWAFVGAGTIAPVAARAGFTTEEVWSEQGRWFARLRRNER
jgi:SAM-dependent methyltransferase